jgi:hypothetical protein
VSPDRAYRAGESVEDYCRACAIDRLHTVIAADAAGRPIRVVCGFCRSEHNYRGGPRMNAPTEPGSARRPAPVRDGRRAQSTGTPFPIVSDRERRSPPMPIDATEDLELMLRRIIREEEPPRPSHRVSTLGAQASPTLSQQRGLDERHLGRVLRGELDVHDLACHLFSCRSEDSEAIVHVARPQPRSRPGLVYDRRGCAGKPGRHEQAMPAHRAIHRRPLP